jgi:hypothetical protein
MLLKFTQPSTVFSYTSPFSRNGNGGASSSVANISVASCGIAELVVGVSSVDVLGGSNDIAVGPFDNSRSLTNVDDGLSLDGNGVGSGIRLVDMDGDSDLFDVLTVDGDIIRDLDALLNGIRLVDDIRLPHGVDNGSVVGLGSLEDGGHSNADIGKSGLVDGAGVSRDELGLSVVELLGHNCWGLLNTGDGSSTDLLNGVRSGHADGGSGGNGNSGRSGNGNSVQAVARGGGVSGSGKQSGNSNHGIHFG